MKKKIVKNAPKKKLVKASPIKAKKAAVKKVKKVVKPVLSKKPIIEKKLPRRVPISIRILVKDLEAIKMKAAKLGVPYQTYINILIHRDASA